MDSTQAPTDTGITPVCDAVVGGGCLGAVRPEACTATAEPESGTTACTGCEPPVYVGGGGSGGCAVVPSMGLPWVLVVGWLLLSRVALAQDLDHFQWLDAGPIPGVVDPDLAEAWSVRGTVGVSYVAHALRVRSESGIRPLVPARSTAEVAASLQVADWFRASLSVPASVLNVQGEVERGLGNVGLLLSTPLGRHKALQVGFELPVPPAAPFSSQLAGVVGFSGVARLGPVDVAGQLRARLQGRTTLPGVQWGSRLEGVVGVRTRGRATVGAAVLASSPLDLVVTSRAGTWPVEAIGMGTFRIVEGLEVVAGGGGGLTMGLGAPRWRAFGGVRFTGARSDQDQDGIGDLRDFCPQRPEDRDEFRDSDGCPDVDNDRDGWKDPDDPCPNEAEVLNGYADDDGCPDALADWRIEVTTEGRAEQIRITVDDTVTRHLNGRHRVEVPPGPHVLRVEAEGHRPFVRRIKVLEGKFTSEIRLLRVRYGVLQVSLVDPDGQRLAGSIEVEGQAYAVAAVGQRIRMGSGSITGSAQATGHLPETFRARLPAGKVVPVEIRLEPEVDAQRPPVLFSHDTAKIEPAGRELIDALARWLLAHPGVTLVRIEGHADEIGSPAYNYRLSVRRAEAVKRALVARGVKAARLDAVGTGEARTELVVDQAQRDVTATLAGASARDVTFRVVVWDE